MLYIRMLVTMAISLFTSRVVLQALGEEDFGVYSIVGGVVMLFSFLNTAITSATQRFLNFELGKGNLDEVNRVFSMSMTVHISISVLLILLGETVGLWFVNTQLNIPIERMTAANWVYQFSLFTYVIHILRIPYNASIIAYERMSFYAYISITEAFLKLLGVFLLLYLEWDKLILYGLIILVVTLTILFIFKVYCIKSFTTSRYDPFWNVSLYKRLLSFSGWSMFGGLANVGANYGLNVLLNIFWGVTVNAAMGIANQVSNAVYGFVSNFQTAFNPQIVKSYASNDHNYLFSLIFQASKFSYYLLFLLSLPVIINTEFILGKWLTIVPDHTAAFCKLMLVFLLIDAISAPLWMAVQATGRIRNYQLMIGSLILLNLPLAYLVLKLRFPPESVLFVRVSINLLAFFIRISYLKPRINFPVGRYIREVVLLVCLVSIMSIPLPLIVKSYLNDWAGFLVSTITALASIGASVYFVGLTKNEKKYLVSLVFRKIKL
ncbi:MAG: lipopolysaccharide biosynthesis protein [Bacteroidales bacterium]|nr:lipopolysaccharide biosynthesis protein [Bacteroidales bacterium]